MPDFRPSFTTALFATLAAVASGCGPTAATDAGPDAWDAAVTDAAVTDAPITDAPRIDAASDASSDVGANDVAPVDVANDVPGVDAAPDAPSPPTAEIHFVGRFDRSDPAGPKFEWPGSAIRTRLNGTDLSMQLQDNGGDYFQVRIDGVQTSVIITDRATTMYPVATGLAPGMHDAEISRRTESFFGPSQFLGFVPGPGSTLVPTPAATRRMEFLGDSITAGYGDEGADQWCHFSAATENHDLSYAAVAARELGADHVAIAWSGEGAYRNNDGTTTDVLPDYYDRTLPTDASSRWDFTAWTPDVVVINLGTNDFAMGDPGAAFADAYQNLLTRVRGYYPDAAVFCAVGPMLTDDYPAGAMALTRARQYITGVVDAFNAAGDARVYYLEFAMQDGTNGFGCDYHPNVVTHQIMGDQLANAVRTQLGW